MLDNQYFKLFVLFFFKLKKHLFCSPFNFNGNLGFQNTHKNKFKQYSQA